MNAVVLQAGSLDAVGAGVVFLLGRLLFGAVLAFVGANHFLNAEEMAGYADAKGVPLPEASVLFSGGMLVAGGLSVATGAYVVVGAGALAAFLLISGLTMHDFWNVDDPQRRQTEMTHLLKNLVMAGAALGFLALAGVEWPYALGVGVV